MSLRLWLSVGVAAVLFIGPATHALASSDRSALMQVSLTIEEQCHIHSGADSTGPNNSPTVRCLHDSPYRVTHDAPEPSQTFDSTDAGHREAHAGEFWEIDF